MILQVHENWIREVQCHRKPPEGASYWDNLEERQCQLLLAASQIKVAKPWLRITINIFEKSSELVQR